MKIVLLAGGKGKRLWPLSTDDKPKQFIKISNSISMLQKTYKHILQVSNDIYISTSCAYIEQVKDELPGFNNLIIEPDSIGTFGAILNIAYYLYSQKGISKDEIISIVPIDHDVDMGFYKNLVKAEKKLKDEKKDICLIGLVPSYPSTQYGYILNDNGKVLSFKEKPNELDAINIISKGGLWNSGIVIFKLSKIIKIISKYVSFRSYDKFIKNYLVLPHNSFDREVLEKEKDIIVIKSFSKWKDMGTIENVISDISIPDKYNTNIYNDEDKKIINDGIKDAIVINSKNGLKIQKKNISNVIYKSWGKYEVLNEYNDPPCFIKSQIITILPNHKLNYQFCDNARKWLFVIIGNGEICIDDKIKKIKKGTTITINKNTSIVIKTHELMKLYEVLQE